MKRNELEFGWNWHNCGEGWLKMCADIFVWPYTMTAHFRQNSTFSQESSFIAKCTEEEVFLSPSLSSAKAERFISSYQRARNAWLPCLQQASGEPCRPRLTAQRPPHSLSREEERISYYVCWLRRASVSLFARNVNPKGYIARKQKVCRLFLWWRTAAASVGERVRETWTQCKRLVILAWRIQVLWKRWNLHCSLSTSVGCEWPPSSFSSHPLIAMTWPDEVGIVAIVIITRWRVVQGGRKTA